jgi:hypothetical protein
MEGKRHINTCIINNKYSDSYKQKKNLNISSNNIRNNIRNKIQEENNNNKNNNNYINIV